LNKEYELGFGYGEFITFPYKYLSKGGMRDENERNDSDAGEE
jgi:hypothetical protein